MKLDKFPELIPDELKVPNYVTASKNVQRQKATASISYTIVGLKEYVTAVHGVSDLAAEQEYLLLYHAKYSKLASIAL